MYLDGGTQGEDIAREQDKLRRADAVIPPDADVEVAGPAHELAALTGVPVRLRFVGRPDEDAAAVDAGVDATAHAADATGRGPARLDDDVVVGAVEGLAGRVRRLGQLARAPQTGAVHQYFLQAVAVLAVGVVAWSVYAVMG